MPGRPAQRKKDDSTVAVIAWFNKKEDDAKLLHIHFENYPKLRKFPPATLQ